ncbi:ShlB/FhaC/HecB family hemolysin secretion/activation protein [Pseudoduganella namucuonensis]|uniref:Hemolysin activation/secretion protein n=1 Tax=Pseudoduganella namucuonensis TaxID=1035707 RepID=A0A1I7IW67_9BURK|nr:ShlB/FhaC/HecB family hemolysin secretion/activation protein [Pseudoduganella namucuonensis]SFU77101.1 Hemolysin activation/secretion protein [Pseudoduganella namucuonensis]
MNKQLARFFAGTLLAAAVSAAWSAEADDGVVRFEISRFNVTGNTLLPPAEVERLLQPFAGKRRDFGDVQRALEALEAAFHARGYNIVTVELPEQELDKGEVRLRVVETKIGRVNVKGNQHFDEANVRRALPDLREGITPDLRQVSAGLRLANDNPARKIALKLQSSDTDGEVDAGLEVTDENPWKAMLNADNTGTDSTGKTHLGFILQHANLWGLDHVATLQYTTTAEKPGRVKVYGVGYHIPLYGLGDAIDLFGSYSNVDSGTITAGVFDLAVSGKGAVYGARYTHNLPKSGNIDSRVVYGVDYKAFKNSVVLLGQELGNDVTVHPLSVNYVLNWSQGVTEAGASATLLYNISGGSRGGQDDFTRARVGAKAGYSALRLSGSYGRTLPKDWQLRLIANAQYSPDALIPGEQFGAGGAGSVRGFGEREISNDSGVGANAELYTPNLCGGGNWQCRALAFYDTAYVKRNHALAGELTSTSIGSVGLGLRLLLSTYINLQLDYGHVVHAGATGRDGANRLHVRLGLSY